VVGVAVNHAGAVAGEHVMSADEIGAGQSAAGEGGAAAQHVSVCVAQLQRPGQQSQCQSQSSGHVWTAAAAAAAAAVVAVAAENLLVGDVEHVHWAVADVEPASQVGAVAQQYVIANSAQSICPEQHSLCHQALTA